jgi:Uma2 family endonuclease
VTVVLGRPKLTADQFLEWSKGRTDRFELENGEIIEMAAETAKHALMKHAATKALEAGIAEAGLVCAVFPDGMSIVVDDSHVRLPDAAVQCATFDPDSILLDAPIVLVEVVSPSSVNRDEKHKLVEYFSIPSVVHYLLLSPEQRVVVHFKRTGEPDRIETRILSEGSIDLTPPGFSVSVADLLGRMPANAA